MFLEIKKGKQRELIQDAISKAGSERELSKQLKISKGSIYRYKFEKNNIPEGRLKLLLEFLGKSGTEFQQNINKKLPTNWGRKKGGLNLIAKKKQDGTFQDTVDRLKKVSSERMKTWHRDMKKNNPKLYHIWQYERFKKVGRGYQFNLKDGTPVRNLLERWIGNFLIRNNIAFEYEPYFNIKGKAYFPDFVIGNVIIEATEWSHPGKDRIQNLIKKKKDYHKISLNTVFFIPSRVRKFYKALEGSIVSSLDELGEILRPL